MSLLVKDFFNFLKNLAPLHIADPQDNNGLQIGSFLNPVSGILLTLDISKEALSFALKHNLNLIISHHPFIFNPIFTIIKDNPKGDLIYTLIKNDLNLICWHTPLDKINNGVSENFVKAINLKSSEFILKEKYDENFGLGRIVYLKKSIKLKNLAKKIAKLIKSWVMVAGDLESSIKAFGVCGGSGSFLKEELKKLGINTLITSDVKYHIAKDAYEEGFNFILIDHGISESFILPFLKTKIQEFLKRKNSQIPIEIFRTTSLYQIYSPKRREKINARRNTKTY